MTVAQMTDNTKSVSTVSIHGVEIARIEHRGEQVVTFAQVDRVHERPDGTAGRTFRDNRARFVEGEDFIEPTSDEIRRMSQAGLLPERSARAILITKRGYLKLVKPMSDDRAWAVQGEMVDRYFEAERLSAADATHSDTSKIARAREARLTFNSQVKLCKGLGIAGTHAIISANQVTKRLVGVDFLDALGIKYLPPDTDSAQINVSTLGQQIGASPRNANRHLVDHGYAIAFRDAKGRLAYEPTEKGRAAGGRVVPTGKKHGDGSPVTQLVWSMATVEALRQDMNGKSQ